MKVMEKTKYITTSIAYINAEPHIGFLLELVSADVLARYARFIYGDDKVFFLTGTDEHGLKIQKAAIDAKLEPQKFADQTAAKYQKLCRDFNISNDSFIRTTDPRHVKFVQEKWQKLKEAGVLEKRSYEGDYCVGCEAFKTERELEDGKCLIHNQVVEHIKEENWFLLINKETKDKIRAWLPAIYPAGRQSEIANIIEGNFDEVSVSRPKDKLSWGVPVPDDTDQTMYVWVDALLNYLSGIELAGHSIEEIWPADIQIIGKDILKFHAIIWPAILIALGYGEKLPEKLLVHGFVNVEGKKMSKSLGNVITPAELAKKYGIDGTRYLLLRQLNYYDDSNFSWAEFDALYNGELANGLGNLVARVIGLLGRFDGAGEIVKEELGQAKAAEFLKKSALDFILDFKGELIDINDLINSADQWVSENKPWTWEKPTTEQITELLAKSNLIEISFRLEPFLPTFSPKIRQQLSTLKSEPLFPRLVA
ncbi:MAG TPA: methionine--tRNA ligase [Candidatus Saccharimonadales bacterium]|nr:methionine--tRNA ligase [Candidatus Saccharimonadales bacterium]